MPRGGQRYHGDPAGDAVGVLAVGVPYAAAGVTRCCQLLAFLQQLKKKRRGGVKRYLGMYRAMRQLQWVRHMHAKPWAAKMGFDICHRIEVLISLGL